MTRTRSRVACAVLVALMLIAVFVATAWAHDNSYHGPADVNSELRALETARPDIVKVKSIGKSARDRDILAVKISDDPATEDSDEHETIFVGNHHAREWMSVEVPLYIAKQLVERYDTDSRVRSLVDNNEIWIVPALNPDGLQFSIDDDRYWRKNRRVTGKHWYFWETVGVDLNRNYGFMWDKGPIGNTSDDPSDITYRGPSAFSEPEVDSFRDLVNDLAQNHELSSVMSYHTYGNLILYPWGISSDKPKDGGRMAGMAKNIERVINADRKTYGYTGGAYNAQQSSDLYATSGDLTDWVYGTHSVPSFTIELRPAKAPKWWNGNSGFSIGTDQIEPTCKENWGAALWLIEQGQGFCPVDSGGGGGGGGPAQNWTDFAFVVDDTGSMGGSISAAREAAKRAVDRFSAEGKYPRYTLITFKDDVSYRGSTSDPATIKSWLDGVYASGGGDWQEEGLGALTRASEVLGYGGRAWVLTDAPPHGGDTEVAATVAKLNAKRIAVDFMYLASDTATYYQTIASRTGGYYFGITPSQAMATADVLFSQMFSGDYLATYTSTETTYTIPVDSSIDEVSFNLYMIEGTKDIAITRPDGSPVLDSDDGVVETRSGPVISYRIDAPATGDWKVETLGAGKYNLKIGAQTSLKVAYTGDANVALGEPTYMGVRVPAGTTGARFSLVYPEGKHVTDLELQDDGRHEDGRAGDGYYAASYTPEHQGVFQLRVSGTSPAGESFIREVPMTIGVHPLEVKSDSQSSVQPGGSATHRFTVVNLDGEEHDFKLGFASENGWSVNGPSAVTVPAGGFRDVDATVYVPSSSEEGVSDSLMMTAMNSADSAISDSASAVTIVDPTPLAADLLPPAQRYVQSHTVQVNVRSAQPVTEMQFAEEDAEAAGPWVPFQQNATVELSAGTGLKRVVVRVRDAAGRESSPVVKDGTVAGAAEFFVDGTAPQVLLAGPRVDATITSRATISAAASDDAAVGKVEFFVDGVKVGQDSAAPYACTWAPLPGKLGARWISVKAYDAAGNASAPVTRRVYVKTPAALTRPRLSGTLKPRRTFYVNGSISPRHTGATQVRVERYRQGKWSTYKVVSATNRASSTGSSYKASLRLPRGTWRVKAYHADNEHLPTWSAARRFTLK